jgi:succinate dehydrogenase / fumarate reductase membrane anchor subunit
MTATIDSPRSGKISPRYRRSGGSKGNFEMLAWLFMRLSGVVLVVLIFGQLFVNLLVGEGIHAIDFWKKGAKYQRQMLWTVLVLWVIVMVGFSIRHLSLAFGGH